MADETPIPGLKLEPSLEAKLDGLDDQLNPIEKEETKDEPEDAAGDTEKTEEDKVPDGGGDAKTSDDATPEDSEEGYAIDDGDEEPTEEETKSDKTKVVENLNSEQKYILDNLQPIIVRGTVGDDKVQEFKVFDPSQLPVGFKYTDDRELSAANKAFAQLEARAEQLQNQYRGQQTAASAKEFKQREDTADRQDIGKLQRDGEIPKFKVDASSKDFDKDPAAVQIQEVLDYKEELNKKYYDEYQAGRPYKHIGFEEAFRMFSRANSEKNAAQNKEDAERREVAKRTSNTRGAETKPKARVHSGMSSRDLDNLIDGLDW